MKNQIMDVLIRCYYYSIHICLGVKRQVKNKMLSKLLFLLLVPILLLRWFFSMLYEKTVGLRAVRRVIEDDIHTSYENELAIVAIAKNEGQYIVEWLEYYKLLGISKVFLYDNDSTDGLMQIVQSYIDSGFVEYTYFPGQTRQLDAYNDAIARHSGDTRYLAVVDCDEFLVPMEENENLPETIGKIFNKCPYAGGIGVNWCIYGSSGLEKKTEGLLMERFLKRAKTNEWNNHLLKTIVNPRLVKDYISPHFPVYILGAWSVSSRGKRLYAWYNREVSFDMLRCNHYFCKSIEEFRTKKSRGLADRAGIHYDMAKFEKYDKNDVYDTTMLWFANKVKEQMEEKGLSS